MLCDLPPGTYEGVVTITAGGARKTIPVELEVLNFVLPDANSLPAMFYFDPVWVKLYHGEDLQAAYHRLAHRHRVELVTDTAGEDLTVRLSALEWCNHPGPSANAIVPRQKSGWHEEQARPRRPVQVQRGGPDVQPAVAADRGLSTLGRASTSRGRAAHEMNEGRRASPAVLPSTITNGPCR